MMLTVLSSESLPHCMLLVSAVCSWRRNDNREKMLKKRNVSWKIVSKNTKTNSRRPNWV